MHLTKKDTLEQFAQADSILDIYNHYLTNSHDTTADTDELYTEIIANEILKDLTIFNRIPAVRPVSQEQVSLINKNKVTPFTVRENFYFRKLTGLVLEYLGQIKDSQIPLIVDINEPGGSWMDLLSYNNETKTMYLITLKYRNSKDTLLKATLENYIHYRVEDKQRLAKDYLAKEFQKSATILGFSEVEFKPAVVVVPGSMPAHDLESLEICERQKLKALALALDINYFTSEIVTNRIIP